ncbi:MAG TPA: P-loop NTPase fold protein [Egibacteraceae bacterium]|jgi:hypothetical protein|nr:P-loop NTPase fold protein [Egibacteraceae bacterium]
MPPERLEPRLHPRLPLYSPGAELAKEEKGRAVGNRRWKARLVVFVLSLALALVLLVVDRYGEWGPAGLLSLGALLLLIVPNAGWAHLELPTPLDGPQDEGSKGVALLAWLRELVFPLAIACGALAVLQLPAELDKPVPVTSTKVSPTTPSSTTTPSPTTTTPSPTATTPDVGGSTDPTAFTATTAPGTVTATTTTTSTAPASAAESAGDGRAVSLRRPVGFLLSLLVAAILLKLVLLRRYAIAARSRHGSLAELDLLPTQGKDLARLGAAILAQPRDEPARLIRLEGRWGDGKSFVLRRLETHLQEHNPGGQAVVVVDVWKHEAEPSLHLAIFEELLATPCYLRWGGWLQYPVLLIPGRYLSSALMKLSLKLRAATFDLPVGMPALPWQRHLERVVARHRRRGQVTVIVLDEIDRAAPLMAQTAITLALRSLDVSGAVVVMSYVEPVLRYKAFNPSVQPSLPDLGSTMEALLFVAQFDRARPALERDHESRSLEAWWPSPLMTDSQSEKRPPYPAPVEVRLRRGFEGTSTDARLRLQLHFDERFLGRSGIKLRPLTIKDAAALPFVFESLRELACLVAGVQYPGFKQSRTQAEQNVIKVVEVALEALLQREPFLVDSPPVRAFESVLMSILAQTRSLLEADELRGEPVLLAAVVEAAFGAAAERVRFLQ